jgi:hypothetical protein
MKKCAETGAGSCLYKGTGTKSSCQLATCQKGSRLFLLFVLAKSERRATFSLCHSCASCVPCLLMVVVVVHSRPAAGTGRPKVVNCIINWLWSPKNLASETTFPRSSLSLTAAASPCPSQQPLCVPKWRWRLKTHRTYSPNLCVFLGGPHTQEAN